MNAHIKVHERLSAGIPVVPQQNDVIAIRKLKIIPSFRQVLVASDEVLVEEWEFELLFLASNCNRFQVKHFMIEFEWMPMEIQQP